MNILLGLFITTFVSAATIPVSGTCRKIEAPSNSKPGVDELAEKYYEIELSNPAVKLKTSTRRCRKPDIANFVEYAKHKVVQRGDITGRDQQDWDNTVSKKFDLEPKSCTIVRAKGTKDSLVILDTKINASLKEPFVTGELLSVIHLNHAGAPKTTLAQIPSFGHKLNKRRIAVEYLCDLDDDESAELVIKDTGQIGYGYIVMKFSANFNSATIERFDGPRAEK